MQRAVHGMRFEARKRLVTKSPGGSACIDDVICDCKTTLHAHHGDVIHKSMHGDHLPDLEGRLGEPDASKFQT